MIMKQVEERYISLLTDFGFDRLFDEAEIAKFTPQEMREYETSKMAYRDIKNSVDTAKREGIAEGMEKGMELGMAKGMEKGMNQKALEIAKNMLAMGLSAEQVAKATQLPLDIIKNQNNL
jgi:predicted transposase/invertase (TIGR01784 family)